MENKRDVEGEGPAGIGTTRDRRIHMRAASGALIPVTVFEGVNAGEHPELAEKLRAGNLNEVILPGEETPIKPAVPVVYHDPARRLLALVLPESLRHQEFHYRRWMLDQLEQEEGTIEPYMRRFETVYDLAQLDSVEAQEGAEAELEAHLNDREIKLANQQRYIEEMEEKFTQERREYEVLIEELEQALEASAAATEGVPGGERAEALDERQQRLDDREAQLEAERQAFEESRQALEQDRQQLDEVADRVERESQRVAETREELETQRRQLEEQARQLQVRELNLEQRELERSKEGGLSSPSAPEMAAPTEATQVVTDDQFIEIVESKDSAEEASLTPESDGASELRPRVEPSRRQTRRLDEDARPEGFEGSVGVGPQGPMLKMVTSKAEAQQFGEEEVAFLFQCQELDGVPVVSATLAAIDDDQQPLAATTVVLDPADPEDRSWLEAFEARVEVVIDLVTEDDEWVGVYGAEGPWRSNIQWALTRWEQWQDKGGDAQAYEEASQGLVDDLEAQVGTMKHPFLSNRFVEFDGASEVMLAVSIVGYWSSPAQLDYLVGRRAFPLSVLISIQKRVVRQALHWGIDPGESLRKLAVEEAIILDEKSLVERLLSNFAEVCVGLRPNDLDPLEEWENWEALIELAAEGGVEPDPDVLELAERSLLRAEEYEAMLEAGVAPVEGGDHADLLDLAVDEVCEVREVGDGEWTYFMPVGVDDQMERLRQDEGDWSDELRGPGRVEAAQLLLREGGPKAVAEVVASAEDMEAVELASILRFMGDRDVDASAWVEQLDLAGERGRFLVMGVLAPQADEGLMEAMVERLVETESPLLQRAYAQALSTSDHLEGALQGKVDEPSEIAQWVAETIDDKDNSGQGIHAESGAEG